MSVTVLHGRCESILPTLPDCSVDAVVTDPPYELNFMGKGWDSTGIAYSVEMWAEVLRVLKPGGHLLSFGGSRTWHRMAVAIEDAGFEMRDCITWHFGSGFPKSLNVARAIDATLTLGGSSQTQLRRRDMGGEYRPHRNAGTEGYGNGNLRKGADGDNNNVPAAELTAPEAAQWDGWGTALKPATEFIVMARKPIAGTVASNVLTWGTGALNVDGCRVGTGGQLSWAEPRGIGYTGGGTDAGTVPGTASAVGRWPANVILDEFAAAEMDRQSGESTSPPIGSVARTKGGNTIGTFAHEGRAPSPNGHGDTGGASRFFYVAKAPKSERPKVNGIAHATVKPLTLIRYLVRLVTPPGGTVLDPFAGSGTTGEACILEGFNAILIEREADHIPLIHHRIDRATDALGLFGEETA